MCDSVIKSKNFHDEDHFSTSFSRIRELMFQRKFCDVTLVLNSHRVIVQKLVLASCSEYFKILFATNKSEYVIESVDTSAVQRVIEFCYTGKIKIEQNNVFKILSVASLFQMQPLLNVCFEFLEDVISDQNCVDILDISRLHYVEDLETVAVNYIQMRFKEVSQTEEFLKIEFNQLKTILKNDYLNVSSEDNVFKCIQRWIKHDENNRTQYTSSLIQCIRLPFLTTEFIFDQVQPFCGSNSNCSNMVLEALRWKLLPTKNNTLDPSQLKPRSIANTIAVIGASRWGAPNRQRILEIYNPLKNEWSVCLDTKTDKTYFNAVIVKDFLFIIGGYKGNVIVNTVESFNVKTGAKTELSPMLTPRSHTEAACIGGNIYVPGGKDKPLTDNYLNDGKLSPLSSMERYDIKANKWNYSSPLLTPRECHGVTVLDNELFIVGGWSTGQVLNSTEAYCPATEKWRKCGSMVVKRCYPGIATVNGYVYAFGGREFYHAVTSAYSSLERYDPKTDSWSIISEFRGARYASGLGTLNNKLVLIGGAVEKVGVLADVDEFDPESRSWKRLSNILGTRELVIVVPVPITWIK